MWQINPTQKQIDKYFSDKYKELKTPSNWVDFAPMCKIRSGGNVVKFHPYDYQIDLVNLILERSVCIVKSRQLGISETITCFMLWRACLNPGYLGLVFSKTQTDSSLLARRMKRMIQSLGLKTVTENLSDIEIKGKGRILFRNSKPDSARGIESVCDVFLDELAFLDTAKEVYDALAPSMQMVGDKARVIAVSTPDGKSGFFYDLLNSNNRDKDVETICEQASKGETEPYHTWVDSGGWGKVLIHWRVHPKYGINPNFLTEVHEKQKLSWDIIEREYNLSFKDSAVGVFSSDLIRKNAIGEIEETIDKEAEYYCGLDTATIGSDYTVLSILKLNDNIYTLVNLYRKRQQTSEYHQYQIGKLINQYKPAKVAIEVTGGVGQIYLEQLSRQFPNIRFEGLKTTGDSKPSMIQNMILALERSALIYPEKSPLIDEMLSFRRDGKKLEAASGKHDDCVMSVAFALYISPFNRKNSVIDLSKIKIRGN